MLPAFLGIFIKIKDFTVDCFLTTVKEVLKRYLGVIIIKRFRKENTAEALPEGFFDDPEVDAKVSDLIFSCC